MPKPAISKKVRTIFVAQKLAELWIFVLVTTFIEILPKTEIFDGERKFLTVNRNNIVTDIDFLLLIVDFEAD